MFKYRVEIVYRTKRGLTQLGLYTTQACVCEAEEWAEEKHLTPYPARKLVQMVVRPEQAIS